MKDKSFIRQVLPLQSQRLQFGKPNRQNIAARQKEEKAMEYNRDELSKMPEYLTLDNVRNFCHISKLTARYYLQSGLLKNSNTGKRTRCYKISKDDLITFLDTYEQGEKLYEIPAEWYQREGHMNARMAVVGIYSMDQSINDYERRTYYKRILSGFPDLLDMAGIVDITGYNRHTIGEWYQTQKLKYLRLNPKLLVPKAFLIDFLSSEDYAAIVVKSKRHCEAIYEMYNTNNKNKEN